MRQVCSRSGSGLRDMLEADRWYFSRHQIGKFGNLVCTYLNSDPRHPATIFKCSCADHPASLTRTTAMMKNTSSDATRSALLSANNIDLTPFSQRGTETSSNGMLTVATTFGPSLLPSSKLKSPFTFAIGGCPPSCSYDDLRSISKSSV